MRWLAAMLLVTSLALPQAGPVPPDERKAGDRAAAEGKFDEAARHYELLARQDPSEENLFFLGSFLLNHNGFEPARKLFEFSVQRYPKSPRAAVGLGVAEYSLGQYNEAVQTLCAAVDLDPGDDRALEFLGKMYDVSPAYATEVKKRLEHFSRVYPDNAFANYYYALCLLNESAAGGASRDDFESERYLRRAIQLDSSFADAHYELAILLEKTNRSDDAIREFNTAISQKPEMLKAHYRLGQLYRDTGQQELANKEFVYVQRLKH